LKATLGAVLGLLLAAMVSAQGAGAGHFRVVDNNGKLVGYPISDNIVARSIDRFWVQFYIHPVYGITDSQAIYAYFTTADCTGTPYMPRYRVFLEGVRVGSKLYYPTNAAEMSPGSLRIVTEQPSYDTACHAITDRYTYMFGVATSIDVDSFGLELPFKAVQ
jgi:hypothetical protein